MCCEIENFIFQGGTELAFMSTTKNLDVAVRFSLSENSLIFKVMCVFASVCLMLDKFYISQNILVYFWIESSVIVFPSGHTEPVTNVHKVNDQAEFWSSRVASSQGFV